MELLKELIPDASTLFSFFKIDSTRRHIFRELLKQDCKFFSPKYVFEELLSDKDKIKKFSAIDELEFLYLFRLLDKQIKQFPESEYKDFLQEAAKISPHGKENKDDPYFALALSLNIPIWSDEKAFKEQSKVKVFSTKELLDMLSKSAE